MRKESIKNNKEIKIIFSAITIIFIAFLFFPALMLFIKSFQSNGSLGLENYIDVLKNKEFLKALGNSFLVAVCSAIITTIIAFILSYTVNSTNLNSKIKKTISSIALLPMLLPTITYGFAIIYSFGKKGLITKILGFQIFNIYGFNGLMLGYIIYTLPIAFLLINNTFKYIDKKFIVVSRVMGDSFLKTFYTTTLRPLIGTLAAAFIQAFFLSFTDFGIPAALGGKFSVVATYLYNEMLGAIPNLNNGAVIAIIMIIPSIISIVLLGYLDKFNFRYNKISQIEIEKNKIRDKVLGGFSIVIIVLILSIFAVIFILPFIKQWPYDISFSLEKVKEVLSSDLKNVYINSLVIALITALVGTLISYGAAIVTSRSSISNKYKNIIERMALITNTIPGMVLGIAFLLAFSGTSIQNTFFIIIICNIIHFFSTPYLMMKNSLSKMNSSWETTAMLMGDSWIKTIIRVVTPNTSSTLLESFSYYFTNSMVTISAVIFIASAKTMVITTKIKELQHYAKFDEIFVLSLLIFFTNIIAKCIFSYFESRGKKNKKESENTKTNKLAKLSILIVLVISIILGFVKFTNKNDEVIIYSNGDDEAITAIKNTLDNNGYKGQYILQSLGTSELGGKLLAEGKDIEADLITMSSYYIDTAQEQNNMFLDLTFETNALTKYSSYYTPITCQEGAIIVNTEVLKANNLEVPTSLKDLTKDEYKNLISIPDITGSSTGWLLVQAIISEYGEDEGREVFSKIIENCGPHLESSGSASIKKVRSGEVGIAFGLRHQAVRDKESGLPINYIDPVEGNFSLTESIAVVNKDAEKNKLAMEMAECIIKNGRKELIKTYPNPIYEGEVLSSEISSKYPKIFEYKLTVDLLKKHQKFSEGCK